MPAKPEARASRDMENMEKHNGLCMVDGPDGLERWRNWHGCRHLEAEGLWERVSADDVCVLNMGGEALQTLLGGAFRQRRVFALTTLAGLDEAQLRRLLATACKRKSKGVLLGGLRLLPLVSAVREVLSGGCLGKVERLTVRFAGEPANWQETLARRDVLAWLQRAGGEAAEAHLEALAGGAEGALSVDVYGTVGEVHGEGLCSGESGRLSLLLGGHSRQRRLSAADVPMMEMQVLGALASGDIGGLPGLLPLRELPLAEQNVNM